MRTLLECPTCGSYHPAGFNGDCRENDMRFDTDNILDAIRHGDRVTVRNRFGQERTGKAMLRGPHGWVLDMGGKYGTPLVATNETITKVRKRKEPTGNR